MAVIHDGNGVAFNVQGPTNTPAPPNAVLIGGKNPSGDLNALQLDANKSAKVALMNSAGNAIENTEGTLLASAARTAQTTSPAVTNHNARGIILYLDVTASSGTGGLRPILRARLSNGKTIWLRPAGTDPNPVTTNGVYAYMYYPGIRAENAATPSTANIVQMSSIALPRSFDVIVNVGDATSYTYELTYSLIV